MHRGAAAAAAHERNDAERTPVVASILNLQVRPGPVAGRIFDVRPILDDEFVVIGFMAGKGGRGALGALCVASYSGDKLLYRGRVGSGLDSAMLKAMLSELEARITPEFPGFGDPPEDAKGAKWVRPELVVSVRFLGFTEGEVRLRAPVFRCRAPF